VLVKFVWSQIVHAPYPDALVFVGSYSREFLLNPDMGKPSHDDKNRVELLICSLFNVGSLSSYFSYQGRDVATPYLSCLNLEDKVNDWRLLGNAVYSPGVNRFNPWSFRHFFTGAEELGFYLLDTSPFGHNFPYILEEYYLPRYVHVAYYALDLVSQKRIGEFFEGYKEAEDFAKNLFCGKQYHTKGICCVNACVRKISHPIGFFSYVKAHTGTICVSELFSFFRRLLLYGGEIVDQVCLE